MQTCSNCGATSREGAKFCTTCGSRLNAVVDPAAASGWESPATNDETRVSSGVSPHEPAQEQDEPSVATTDEPVGEDPVMTSWSWGQSTTTEESEESKEEPIAADMTEAYDVSETTGSEETTSDAVTVSESEPSSDTAAEGESLSAWASQWAEPTPENEDVDEDEPVVTPTVVERANGIEDERETPSPQARAHALLYELRELIDSTVREQESTAAIATGGVGNETTLATLTAIPGDEGRFDNLRTILEKARENPRDVDTMLNLLGEINSLIALIDSHEAYTAAVNTAIGQLRDDR